MTDKYGSKNMGSTPTSSAIFYALRVKSIAYIDCHLPGSSEIHVVITAEGDYAIAYRVIVK